MDEKQKEEEILSALKEWRSKIAGENNILDSAVLRYSALEKISLEKPKTKTELMNMRVISEMEFEKYGESLLRIVAEKTGTPYPVPENEIEKYGEALRDLINEETSVAPEKKTGEPAAPVKESFLEVSKISEYIKNKLNDPNLSQIYVRGEVKNLAKSPPPAKHFYFDIKERNYLLSCVFPENKNKDVNFKIENGSEVFVFGSIQASGEKSSYQLNVDSVLPAWKGELIFKFEKLKEKLAREGLFDEKNKREIPYLYKTLGLIVPNDSKAHAEVIEVLKRRFPVNIKRIFFEPQRESASKDIINAIKALNEIEEIGAILMASDDGAIERIKCFNDEDLARAIYESKIPIITGIGNETDYTIADLVADKRAATPGEAAKIAVPDRDEVIDQITKKKEIPETRHETHEAYAQKELPPIERLEEPERPREIERHREPERPREIERHREPERSWDVERRRETAGKKDMAKNYKLILLVAMLVVCILILIFLVMMIL